MPACIVNGIIVGITTAAAIATATALALGGWTVVVAVAKLARAVVGA